MSSTASLRDTNEIINKHQSILFAFNDPKCLVILHLLHKLGPISFKSIVEQISLESQEIERILTILKESKLVFQEGETFSITQLVSNRLDRGTFSLDFLVGLTLTASQSPVEHPLRHDYEIKELIGRGATSVTFRATQSGTYRDRTLKVFLPDAISFNQLDEALRKRATVRNKAIPEVFDAGEISISFPDGRAAIVACVALDFINNGAKTFSEYLESQDNINPEIFIRFIERVGGALKAIEEAGLEHGDLHEGNILVTSGSTRGMPCNFWVIDFIGVPSTSSPNLIVPKDIENFRDHLLKAVIIACERHPGHSARLLLGERVFKVLQKLRAGEYHSFTDMLEDFYEETVPIPIDYFHPPNPQPFEWLRVEWFPSPDLLYKLFQPASSSFQIIRRFGNTWISGPRGCGKSHYLRVLAFHPQVIAQLDEDVELKHKIEQLEHDFREQFGVLFACRLGEFKGFAPEALGVDQFDLATQLFLKHILILKIWNKTLTNIHEGFKTLDRVTGRPVLDLPEDFREFVRFLEERLGKLSVIDDASPTNVFLQCVNTCIAKEISAVAVWHDPVRRPDIHLLDERDLDAFFAIIKQTIPVLRQARFYILVDDASYGHVHFELQKVLNSLIRAVQAHHCFKITYDKYMYTLETADGRNIDPRHELTYVDLGEVSTKTQRETATNLSNYMAEVINLRLKYAGYNTDIRTLLGDSQDVRTFLSALSLPGARRPKKGEKATPRPSRTKAYYAGWNIVWSISHGSVRTLLELVEYIFKLSKVTKETLHISLKDQDIAVRSFSNRHYKALSMLPGELDRKPLGQVLQSVLSAIGKMSRMYLERYDTGEEDRWYETISIERVDNKSLDNRAQFILKELVREGLLLEEGVTFSRSQMGLSRRYDMNKIFAPAFQTTYRVRNHMFMRSKIFEEFLLHPDVFVNRHRKKLDELTQPSTDKEPRTLFG